MAAIIDELKNLYSHDYYVSIHFSFKSTVIAILVK